MKRRQKIDTLLRDWAAENQPDEETRERLRRQVCESLRGERIPRTISTAGRVRTSQRHTAALRWTMAAATVVLVAGMALFFARPTMLSRSACKREKVSAPADESLAYFEEVARLFKDHLRWAVETGSGLHLNVEGDPVQSAGGCAPPLLVETVVLTESAGSGVWRQVWKARTLTCPEELVETPANGTATSKMLLWAHRLPDGNLAVDTEISLSQSSFSGSFNGVLVPGKTQDVATLRKDGRIYRVQQRVLAFPAKEKV